jgi:branched-chain amino acid transport system ATP-binding protein
MALLTVANVAASYGQFQALFDVSLALDEGAAVCVIGANGAGKTTLLKVIAGTVPATAGTITFDGRNITDIQPHERVELGIALVPEGRRIFSRLSVDENLAVGAYSKRRGTWNRETLFETFPILARLAGRAADRLSGGEQQALAIARALMSNPRVLLLDEVSLGLAPIVVKQLYEALPIIREKGCSLIIVEQDINQALAASSYAYCMLEGRVSLAGVPSALTHEQISSAYFGIGAPA